MVKSYLRYVEGPRFGVIASPTANAVFDATGKCAVAAALEDVVVWNLKQGESVQRWHDADNTAEVTAIVRCQADPERFAVGYADGAVRVWTTRKTVAAASGSGSTSSAHCLVTFRGHASAVTALAFDRSGTRLATGARDTDLILWDLVGETGLFRYA